jgi:hypothetical protein
MLRPGWRIIGGALLLLSCAEGATPGPWVEVRDSAGIRVVETVAEPPAPVGWEVSDSPAVRIGTAAGAAEYEIFRASSGTTLEDGTIVVVNGGTHELRYYDASGRFLRTVGGEGDGPGELRNPLRLLRVHDDSLLVVDFRGVSLFDSDGAFIRSTPTPIVRPEAAFADGSLIGRRFAPGQDPFALGASRPQIALVRWWPDGGDTATIAIVPGDAVYRMATDDGAIVNYSQPFGARSTFATRGDELFLGVGTTFEIRVHGLAGALRRIYRRRAEPTPVTPQDVAALEEVLRSTARSERSRTLIERLLAEWTVPATQPHFDRILVDARGYLWARRYSFDSDSATSWSIFDPDGSWMGDVALPPPLDVWEIGQNSILGLEHGEDDVEYVVAYSLRR